MLSKQIRKGILLSAGVVAVAAAVAFAHGGGLWLWRNDGKWIGLWRFHDGVRLLAAVAMAWDRA